MKNTYLIPLAFSLFWLPILGKSQNSNSSYESSKKHSSFSRAKLAAHSIEIGFLDPTGFPLGIQYGLMLSERSSVMMGLGLESMGNGFRYYLNNPRAKKIIFSAGIESSWLWGSFGLYEENESKSNYGFVVYAPFGLHYWDRRNLMAAITFGPMWLDNPRYLGYKEGQIPFYLTTSVGYRFGYDVADAKHSEPSKHKSLLSGRIGLINPFVAMTYEYLFTPWLSGEFTFGLFGIAGGINAYYPALREGRVSMKAGIQTGLYTLIYDSGQSYHMPLGVTYLSKNRWLVGMDIGPQFFDAYDLYYGISVRLGITI